MKRLMPRSSRSARPAGKGVPLARANSAPAAGVTSRRDVALRGPRIKLSVNQVDATKTTRPGAAASRFVWKMEIKPSCTR